MSEGRAQVGPLYDELLAAAPDAFERERRRIVLDDIAARIREDGPRTARPSPDRGHQFKPFAALKGYHELAYQQEAKVAQAVEPRPRAPRADGASDAECELA